MVGDFADPGQSAARTGSDVPDPAAWAPAMPAAPDATVVAHHQSIEDADFQPLGADQVEYLLATQKELTDAVWLLAAATTIGDILQFVPTVLARANAIVLGDDEWEDHLGYSYSNWIGTATEAGTEEQFRHARDQIVHGGTQLAAEVEEWIQVNDQTMLGDQGRLALHRLARTADAAYQYLMVGPGSVAYAADHPDDDGGPSDYDESGAGEPDGEGYQAEADDWADAPWADDSEELT